MAKAIQNFFKGFTGSDRVVAHQTPDGRSGTEIYGGGFQEEYLDKFLEMPEGIKVFDEMRRSDAQITMLRGSVRNPIVNGKWFVDPVDDSDEEGDIAKFVEHVLFRDMGYADGSKHKTWPDFITEALSMLDFGHSVFEVVHKVVRSDPTYGSYLGLQDLGFRAQTSIFEWNLLKNGGIDNIRQWMGGDLDVDAKIAGRNLLVYSANKEGDNYEGISLLRPIYGNWMRKNLYLKLQAIGVERGSTGVPVGTLGEGKTDDTDQITKFKNIMKRFTSHQSNYLMIPAGFEMDVFDLKHDPEKLDKAIESEDKRMAKAWLANFMELGMGGKSGGGSYSLGSDLSDIFLGGIQIYANQIAEGLNYKVLPNIVKAKFGARAVMPQLKVTGINDKAGKEKAEIAAMLTKVGLIQPSDQLEDALNRDFSFPIRTQEDKDKQRAEDEKKENDAIKEASKNAAKAGAKPEVRKFAEQFFMNERNPVAFIDSQAKVTRTIMQMALEERSDLYLKHAERDLKSTDNPGKQRALLQSQLIPGQAEYKKDLELLLAQTSATAVNDVLAELKGQGMRATVKFDEANDILKNVPVASREKLRVELQEIVELQDSDLRKNMFFIASQKLDTTDSVDRVIADMRAARDKYVGGSSLAAGATNIVSGTVNTARNAVFQTEEVFEEIESFVIVNPDPQAAICVELAGRVFSKEEYKTADLPPYHHNCQSTVAAQLTGQDTILPTNPIGLTPTGSEAKVARIIKSKTF